MLEQSNLRNIALEEEKNKLERENAALREEVDSLKAALAALALASMEKREDEL